CREKRDFSVQMRDCGLSCQKRDCPSEKQTVGRNQESPNLIGGGEHEWHDLIGGGLPHSNLQTYTHAASHEAERHFLTEFVDRRGNMLLTDVNHSQLF
ncbi:hypothetical protein XELAEV_18008836mg, partial [Xenopus laevis]